MQAGLLRHQIKIQQKTLTADDYGGTVESWSDFATVWASIEPLSGRELVNAQAVHAEVTTRITMRYLAGVTAAMRVAFEGVNYNIHSVIDPEMRHRELILLVSSGMNEG